MRSIAKVVAVAAMLGIAVPNALAQRKSAPQEGSNIVIVFRDGHRQSFRLADVASIEFSAPANASASPAGGRDQYRGEWKVGDGAGGTFFITLQPDGSAKKSIGSSHGTWIVVNGEARINWDDGWHDIIRKVGSKYQKVAFGPGKSFSDDPANVADAEHAEPL